MIQKIIIALVLGLIIWGGWKVTQNTNYQTDHTNVSRTVNQIQNIPGL